MRYLQNIEKCYNSDIENEGQDQGEEELDLHYSTEYVRIHIDEFFSEFYLPDNIHLQRVKDLMTRGKSQISLKITNIIVQVVTHQMRKI